MATAQTGPAGRGCGRASSSRLAAGARRRPRTGAGGGRSRGRTSRAGGGGRAGGGTCCLGPCAPGRLPLFSSWRSRRRRAAPRRSRVRPLRTDGAVSGPRPAPGPAAALPPGRPPAARRTKGRRRYLGPCAPGTRRLPAGSAGSSAPSYGPPAPARASGRRRPLPGPLRPAPLAARPARLAAPLPGLPRTRCALGRHPPPQALKLTLKGEWRPAQPMGAGTRALGAGAGQAGANGNQQNASGGAENVDRCEARFG